MSRRRFPGIEWWLFAVAVAEWVALKFLEAAQPPEILAILVILVMTAFAVRLIEVVWRGWRGYLGAGSAAAEVLLIAGMLSALGAGMANWALSLQGAVIVHEGETAVLHGGAELQEFAAGPFARLEEMDLVLTLKEVELVAAGGGTFNPRSHLVLHWRGEPRELAVDPNRSAESGTLRFFQGAFGFAPRIVIERDTTNVFDRVVPFISDYDGPHGVSFAGRFTLASEALEVAGEVDLSSLDERLRGHARLRLKVWHEGVLLGQGNLLPGHFADLEKGYRIGFVGLQKWSEIDLSRRSYGRLVLYGGGAVLLGGLLRLLAWWRSW